MLASAAAAESRVVAQEAAAAEAAAKAAEEEERAAMPPPAESGFESVLERVGMLSLALSRSGTSADSPRRLRLLRQLEASVDELEGEAAFDETALLGEWRSQIAAAWAAAPPDAASAAAQAAQDVARRSSEGSSETPMSLNDVVDIIGDRMPQVEFDVSRWRLSLKKAKPKRTR